MAGGHIPFSCSICRSCRNNPIGHDIRQNRQKNNIDDYGRSVTDTDVGIHGSGRGYTISIVDSDGIFPAGSDARYARNCQRT